MEVVIDKINSIFRLENVDSTNVDDLRVLRNMCAKGSSIQHAIASNEDFQLYLRNLLFRQKPNENSESINQLQTVGWQLMANITVNNEETLSLIWQKHGEDILEQCYNTQRPLDKNTDIMLMIIYNIMKSNSVKTSLQVPLMFRAVVCIWQSVLEQKCSLQFDFLHFIFEEFLVNDGRNTIKCYAQLNTKEKLIFLDYLVNYLRQDSPNGLVHSFILQYISKDFKMKSDCILRVSSMQEIDKMKPQEAYALLRCIASASGSEHYTQYYATDHSLFLNVSSLLRCLVAASKSNEKNIFTPMNKLEEVAPTSTISANYQSEISYELKTLLVRCIANLLYNNETNKTYCLDTQLMPALFECTNMDARNPCKLNKEINFNCFTRFFFFFFGFCSYVVMKEWSILAIRNACIGCPEIQQVIANLTQQGPAQNDILTELNLDLGSLRINPGRE